METKELQNLANKCKVLAHAVSTDWVDLFLELPLDVQILAATHIVRDRERCDAVGDDKRFQTWAVDKAYIFRTKRIGGQYGN